MWSINNKQALRPCKMVCWTLLNRAQQWFFQSKIESKKFWTSAPKVWFKKLLSQHPFAAFAHICTNIGEKSDLLAILLNRKI